MTLFEECLEALKEKNNIMGIFETNKLFNELKREFPMTSYGRIDWSKSTALNQGVYSCDYFEQILSSIKDKKQNVIILWDESTLPAIESTLETVFNVIDDVTAVAFNTWIYLRKSKKVIEFYHDGSITVGITTIK